jgi:quinol monooxygenase YgiN
MSVLYILELEIEPDKVDGYLAMFPAVVPDTRAFAGCEGITIHRSEDDPNRIVLLEYWASKEAHETYLSWRRERGDMERFSQGLAGPPSGRYFSIEDV